VGEHGVTPIRTYTEEEALELGLIGDDPDDWDQDGSVPAPAESRQPTAVAMAKRALDNLRQATVRA
jgi:hypothetical protein